jgi:hypothetical protein
MLTGSSEILIAWKSGKKTLTFLYGNERKERGYGNWKLPSPNSERSDLRF